MLKFSVCKTDDSKFILYRSILILQERNFKMNKRVWLKAGVLYYPPRDCVWLSCLVFSPLYAFVCVVILCLSTCFLPVKSKLI